MFREFVESQYDDDPQQTGRFVLSSYKLVRIIHHAYRGYRKIDNVKIEVGGSEASALSTTRPSWKLIPEAVLAEAEMRQLTTIQVIEPFCQLRRRDRELRESGDGSKRPPLFGAGVYMVDARALPGVMRLLRTAQIEYEAAFDRWTTEDGYNEFCDLLKAQMGELDYEKAKDLLPDRHGLRSRYSLDVAVLPFQLSDAISDDPEAEAGRRATTVELFETIVRGPREDAAARWRAFAAQLVAETNDGEHVAQQPIRKKRDGTTTFGSRGVRGLQLEVVRRETEILLHNKGRRTLDAKLVAAATSVLAELPTDPAARTDRAAVLNRDDVEAVRVGKLLLAAAAAAEDESGMCEGLSRALRGEPPLIP